VAIECRYPVITLALTEILKDKADVYEWTGRPPGISRPSCIVVVRASESDGASDVGRLVVSNPGVAVLVFGIRDDPWLVREALRAGARGFLHAGMRPEQIVRALRLASLEAEHGGVDRQGLPENDTAAARETMAGELLAALTPRQREIMELVCEGLSNAQIGKRLFLTESTVKQHLYAAYRLLKVRNRVQAAKLVRSGSIGPGGHTN
jgi:DNA-binding NarL/FixJ family response regulator